MECRRVMLGADNDVDTFDCCWEGRFCGNLAPRQKVDSTYAVGLLGGAVLAAMARQASSRREAAAMQTSPWFDDAVKSRRLQRGRPPPDTFRRTILCNI